MGLEIVAPQKRFAILYLNSGEGFGTLFEQPIQS